MPLAAVVSRAPLAARRLRPDDARPALASVVENWDDYECAAVFHDDKCVKVHEAVDLCHAASLVYAHEAVLRWNIKNGKTVACYMEGEITGFAFHLVQA